MPGAHCEMQLSVSPRFPLWTHSLWNVSDEDHGFQY